MVNEFPDDKGMLYFLNEWGVEGAGCGVRGMGFVVFCRIYPGKTSLKSEGEQTYSDS